MSVIKDTSLEKASAKAWQNMLTQNAVRASSALIHGNWDADCLSKLDEPMKSRDFSDKCSECKGTRIYQPLIGPPEPCKACSGDIKGRTVIQEVRRELRRSKAVCVTCGGTDYFPANSQGTPGPCPTCN